jgi:predicted lipid-binding transport protein (Tim44 family)
MDLSHSFDIVLFAMVALFLVLRLRSVLGRRTGNEQRRDPFVPQPGAAADKIVTLAPRAPAQPMPPAQPAAADAVASGLVRIRAADSGFDPEQFLQGARAAFEMIVAAFAEGDKARLRPLLSDEVFSHFAAAVDERNAAKETLETRILQLKTAEIVGAELGGRTAQVTAELVSDQINVLRAHDGSVVDGHPDNPIEKTDFWTFARDTRSTDPNWVLVATGSG